MALFSPRIFVQEWIFYQFGTLFYNHVLCIEHCPWRHLCPFQEGQVMQTSARWPCLQPTAQNVTTEAKKLVLHFKSGVTDASGWDSTEAGEIWTLRNKFPYFLTGNLCMTE